MTGTGDAEGTKQARSGILGSRGEWQDQAERGLEEGGPEPAPGREDQGAADQSEAAADQTREALIALCDAGILPETQWSNRDTARAQTGLGECRALLMAGCAFEIDQEDTDDHFIWIWITVKGFDYFEYGRMSRETFYLPTRSWLAETAGRDWYR